MPAHNGTVSLLARLLLLAPFVLAAPLAAADWPQWRGPSSSGVSPESALPVTWSATENIAWKAPLAGLGTSSPIVSGDTVFVTSQTGRTRLADGNSHPQLARDDGELARREAPIGGTRDANASDDVWLVVEAFARADGKRRWMWRTRAAEPIPSVHEKHNLATPTPVTDGKRVFAWFGNGQIVALDMDGRVIWSRHLGVEHAARCIADSGCGGVGALQSRSLGTIAARARPRWVSPADRCALWSRSQPIGAREVTDAVPTVPV